MIKIANTLKTDMLVEKLYEQGMQLCEQSVHNCEGGNVCLSVKKFMGLEQSPHCKVKVMDHVKHCGQCSVESETQERDWARDTNAKTVNLKMVFKAMELQLPK